MQVQIPADLLAVVMEWCVACASACVCVCVCVCVREREREGGTAWVGISGRV